MKFPFAVSALLIGILVMAATTPPATTPQTVLPTLPITSGNPAGVAVVSPPISGLGPTPPPAGTSTGVVGFAPGAALGPTLGTVTTGAPVTNLLAPLSPPSQLPPIPGTVIIPPEPPQPPPPPENIIPPPTLPVGP